MQHLIPQLSMKETSALGTPGGFSWFKMGLNWNNQRQMRLCKIAYLKLHHLVF